MFDVNIIIIGAGVIGLSIAEALANVCPNILLIEKNSTFGQETSSRNSEVIHGGMYYPAGSMKAKLCVEGRRLLYDFCKNNNIPHKKLGKVVIATDEIEKSELYKLYELGKINGVENLILLDKSELCGLEPNVEGLAALYSPETGIIDSHRFMSHIFNSLKEKGVVAAFNCEAVGIQRKGGKFVVAVKNEENIEEVVSGVVINSAGLDSDRVAAMAGIDVEKLGYCLHYCKGEYFRVSRKDTSLIKILAYPVPKPKDGGLGIHATLDLAGGLRLGPDAEYSGSRIKDYSVNEAKKTNFYLSAKRFLPFLIEADIYPDTSGIRPKLQVEGGEFRDFVIRDESDKGLPGFINLVGIESPGLTACLAIADMVKKNCEDYL